MNRMIRYLAIGCVAAAIPLATAPESQAFFGWWRRNACCDPCNPCATARTTYRPLFGGWFTGWRGNNCCSPCATCAPACSPCATGCSTGCQTCQMVPQTCFRTECVSVPVTTCRACTTCDPCTGCARTVMRPVTTFVQQVRRVPVTTYRMVAAPSCCGTTALSAPSFAPAMGSGCSTCNSAPTIEAPISSFQGPGTTTIAPAPAFTPGPAIGPTTIEPTLPATGIVPRTFEGTSHRGHVQPPIPSVESDDSSDDSVFDPDQSDRTTMLPSHRTWSKSERTAAIPAVHAQTKTSDNSGWRASNR